MVQHINGAHTHRHGKFNWYCYEATCEFYRDVLLLSMQWQLVSLLAIEGVANSLLKHLGALPTGEWGWRRKIGLQIIVFGSDSF